MDENREVEKSLEELAEIQQEVLDDKNREHAVLLANDVIKLVGNNWFTINRLVSKSGLSRELIIQKLQILAHFGLVSQRIGDFKDGKKDFRQPIFKVTISKEDKENAIDRVIDYYKNEIVKLELAKANLK